MKNKTVFVELDKEDMEMIVHALWYVGLISKDRPLMKALVERLKSEQAKLG